ncbi:MAG: potassium transporter TrkA [Candidatus Coatesbacteria bacterium RBG_13_66_14]|uniref:Potassium transporter TrkA n=1 Tax=Candidatus Coatesbacteria bacterium RBG_13_66_14 TaxID=1817816 RepID=A0A1F5EXG7_9BACT|nr:MAG: potassium transporter TrkA [Candidatus Coatesbacteria bacterium RBG_13_66_14]
MRIILAGTGRTLYYLCRTFISKGWRVSMINPRAEECRELAQRLKAVVVHGALADPILLEETGALGADAFLAVSSSDADNLVSCQLAALRFGIPRVLALVNDPDNEDVFRRLGVEAFCPTPTIAGLVEQRSALDGITNLVPVAGGAVNITELELPAGAPATEQPLGRLELPEESLVACLVREGRLILPAGTVEPRPGDRLIVVTLPANHGRVLSALLGPER